MFDPGVPEGVPRACIIIPHFRTGTQSFVGIFTRPCGALMVAWKITRVLRYFIPSTSVFAITEKNVCATFAQITIIVNRRCNDYDIYTFYLIYLLLLYTFNIYYFFRYFLDIFIVYITYCNGYVIHFFIQKRSFPLRLLIIIIIRC